jgi:glycosyltransferase involved in cell wall biosynthesis
MSEQSKLCFILNFAPHYRQEIFLRLQEEFNASFYFGDNTLAKSIKKVDYSLFKIRPKELRFIRLFSNFNWLKGSISIILKSEYKTFIFTGEAYCISTWFCLLIARVLGKKTFLWTHGWYGSESGFRKIIKKAFFKLSDAFFLYGDHSKKLMIREGFASDKIHVVYNSLFFEKQRALRGNLKKSNINSDLFIFSLPVVIFIGRITHNKKLVMLLDVLAYAKKNNMPLFNVMIIGDGEALTSLEHTSVAYGVNEYCFFRGSCYDESILSNHIYNADIFIAPGEIGLAGIHSLSYGTPVISHNNFANQGPEFEAIIGGVTGEFFNEDDIQSLSAVISNWLKRYPNKTDTLINNCFSVIDEKYNPDYQMQVFKSVLN